MREAGSLRVVACALLLGAVAAAALGQEPRPAEPSADGLADPDGGIQLTFAWRFHPGDDASWADPALDDTGWELVEPRMAPGKLPRGGWPGVGWFRRHLRIEPALWGRPLVMRIEAAGAAEVYLDGQLLYRAGTFVAGVTPEAPPASHGPWAVAFSPRPDHVVAVRYSCATVPASGGPASEIGFTLWLRETDTVIQARSAVARRNAELLGSLVTVLVFVALLHLALYWFYPRLRENLFYALYMALFALIVFRDFENAQPTRLAWMELLDRIAAPAPPVSILLGLLTYNAVRTRPFPRTWKAFTVAAIALVPAVYFSPQPYATLIWSAFFAAMLGEVIRVEVSGRTTEREGAWILLIGMAVLASSIALQVLINLRVIRPIAGLSAVYVFGIFASVMTMSLFLARTFARTSLHLERRLTEVESLSGQILEQERAAHRSELHRRLLEAENARKSRELDEGRSLQLSMLAPAVPEVAGLEVAVAMTTASEVGGDYYDFRTHPDGSLVVAVGDATGHGVAAGIMVTAVKALFTTRGGEASLAAILAECDRVLRGMRLRHLHMCLALARLTPRLLTVCSAAMPPVLVWRANTGEVSELGAGALPLGGRLTPVYEERSAALDPGDTLLFATDGFPELVDPEGNSLGFEGAAEALRAAAGAPAREVVARLTAAATAWRREREQADDITFVVVRVEG